MKIRDFLTRMLGHLGIENSDVIVDEQPEMVTIQIQVDENDSGLLIGYHGDVLSSIQKILQVVYRDELTDKKIIVNINDYKQRREAQLKEMAEKAAERVLETQQPYIFSYLPANERLIIHQTISENDAYKDLESVSVGEGRDRRLQIRLRGTEE